jgi:predicted permease
MGAVITFSTIMQAVLPVYILVLIGLFLRRMRVLTPETDAGIFKMVVHLFYPCLILDKTLSNELVRQPQVVVSGIGLGFAIIIVGFFLAAVVGRLVGLEKGKGMRTFGLSAGIQNYGYTAIPLLVVLFAGDKTLGVLFVHSLGVELALWGVGLVVLTGKLEGSWRHLLNGPIVAVVVGLILAYSGAWRFFESGAEGGPLLGQILRQVMAWLGAAAVPVALILIGAVMFDFALKERPSLRIGAGALLVRVVLMPVVILCCARYLPLIIELKQVLIVQAAMPAAVTPVILARQYGGSPGVAVQVILATSVAALVTIPVIVSLGLKFVLGAG